MEDQERKNPVTRAYNALDNVIMKGVNTVVKSYNWTTGKTKTDLANKMLTVASILESAGYFGLIGPFVLPICGGSLFLSHLLQEQNEKTELAEQKSMESGAVDYEIVRACDFNSQWGLNWVCLATCQTSLSLTVETPEYGFMIASGYAVRAGSHYVMRADFLPPKKNCFSRGLEKLAELADEYAPKILPKPELNLVPELARR